MARFFCRKIEGGLNLHKNELSLAEHKSSLKNEKIMDDNTILDVDDSNNIDPDKTGKNEDPFSDLPKEDDELLEDQKGEPGDKDKKIDRAEIAQKIKYREKFLQERTRSRELEHRLKQLEDKINDPKQPTDDKEKQAREYLRNLIKEEQNTLAQQKLEEERSVMREFEEKIDSLLTDNPEFTEDQLLETIEEFKVEPEVAIKFLKKQQASGGVKKPKMPVPKRSAPAAKPVLQPAAQEKRKSIWEVAAEARQALKEHLSS